MPMREVRLQIDELTDRRQKVYRLSCQPNKDSPRMYFMGTACYWLAYSELKSKFGKMSGILLPAKKDLAFRKNSLLKMADFTCALTDPRVLFSKAKLYVFEDSKQNYALLCEQNGEILNKQDFLPMDELKKAISDSRTRYTWPEWMPSPDSIRMGGDEITPFLRSLASASLSGTNELKNLGMAEHIYYI